MIAISTTCIQVKIIKINSDNRSAICDKFHEYVKYIKDTISSIFEDGRGTKGCERTLYDRSESDLINSARL